MNKNIITLSLVVLVAMIVLAVISFKPESTGGMASRQENIEKAKNQENITNGASAQDNSKSKEVCSIGGGPCEKENIKAKELSTVNKIKEGADNSQVTKKANTIQVFLFHRTQRCISCINIGKYTKEAIDEYFNTEVKGGMVEFREVNIDLAENKALAEKFQASGSSLFFNNINKNGDNIVEDVQVWKLLTDKNEFKEYIKSKVNGLLSE